MSLNVPLLRQSFELVLDREPAVTHRFYEILFARYPQVKPMFGQRNTAQQQEKMLAEALAAVIHHLEDEPWLKSTLESMGAKHKGYGVTDPMYDWVGASLLATLAEVAGDAWNDELQKAWADAYGALASMMKAGAARA